METKILDLAVAMAERHRSLKAAEWVMRWFGVMTFGVERIDFEPTEACMRYVNRGDTYVSTVIKDCNGYSVCSWGAWLEAEEMGYTESTGESGCPNCGEWSDLTDGCGHCGYED